MAGVGKDTERVSVTEFGCNHHRQFAPVCMRTKLIKEILGEAERNPLIVFRAPPGMGKTSLLYLLKEHIENQDPKQEVFHYSFLDYQNRGHTSLAAAWGSNWIDELFVAPVGQTNERKTRFIFFDDLQVLFGKAEGATLWGVFKYHLNIDNPIRVIAFVTKGELVIELNQLQAPDGTYEVEPYIPSCVFGGDALLFSDEEVGELVSSFNSKIGYLPTDAATILFHFTGGHPLHLQQLLVHIDNIWQRIKDPLTTQQLLWILEQGAAVISSCGAAPNFLGIHKSTKKYLRHIIRSGQTIFPFMRAGNEEKLAIRDAINRGVLRFTACHNENSELPMRSSRKLVKEWDTSVAFVSPLIKNLTIQYVWGINVDKNQNPILKTLSKQKYPEL